MKTSGFAVTMIALLLPAPALAQDQQPEQGISIIEGANLARFMSSMDEMCEMTDEIVFAQSVLILAEHHGWDLWSDDFAGSGQLFYLFNLLEESELPVIRLMNATRRNPAITEEDLSRAERLFADYSDMRLIAQRIYDYVAAGEVEAAAENYLEHTIPMRRQMRLDCYTVADAPRRRIDALARDARLRR